MEWLSPKKEWHVTIAKFSDCRPTKTIFVKNQFFTIKNGRFDLKMVENGQFNSKRWLKVVSLTQNHHDVILKVRNSIFIHKFSVSRLLSKNEAWLV